MYNNITLTIFGLIVFLGGGFLMHRYANLPENKGLSFGVLIKKLIIRQISTIFVSCTILLVAGESLMAASVAGEDDRVSVLARFISHMAIGFLAFVGALSWMKTVANFVTSVRERNPTKIVVRFLLLIIIFILTFGAPVANTILLAHAFKQSAQLHLFWLDMMSNDYAYFRAMAEYGISMPYSSWSALHNAIAASVILNFAGILIIAIESLESYATMSGTSIFDEDLAENAPTKKEVPNSKDSKAGEEANEEEETVPDKNKKKGVEKLSSNLESLVKYFYDNTHEEKVKKVMEHINKILNGRNEQENIATGFSAATLISEMSKVDVKNVEQVKKMKEKIEKFIGGSKSGNKDASGKVLSLEGGLGYVLGKEKKK